MKNRGTRASFAITSTGEVLISAQAVSGAEGAWDRDVWLPLSGREQRALARRVDDALAEAAARIFADRQRRRRARARKNTRRDS